MDYIGAARVGNVPYPKLAKCIEKVTKLSTDPEKCISVPNPKSKLKNSWRRLWISLYLIYLTIYTFLTFE